MAEPIPEPAPREAGPATRGRPLPRFARRALRAAAIALLAYAAVLGALFLLQRRLTYFPERLPPDRSLALPAGMEEVRIRARDGLEIHGLYAPPPPGGLAVLFLHGNAGNVEVWRPHFEEILRFGPGGLLPDYRGFGKSPGRPSEEGLYADAHGALDFLEARGYPPSRVVLFGKSLGTGVAVEMARARGAAALVLENPYTSVPAAGQRHVPFVPVGLLMRDRFDSLSKAGGVRCPVLVIWGGEDRTVPPDLSEAVFEALPGPKEALFVPGAGHMDIRERAPREYEERWRALLARASSSEKVKKGESE